MRKYDIKHFGVRVENEVLEKFKYASAYQGRSANAQLVQLMLKFIASYEKEHGEIALDEADEG